MSAWLGVALAGALAAGTGLAPDPNQPPDPNDPNDPNDPPPDPDPDPDPTPDPVPDPDPPLEPKPPEPSPEPEPAPTPDPKGGGGDGGGTVEPEPGGDGEPGGDADAGEVTPAPFAQLDVADRGSEIDLGGDLTIGPLCRNEDRPFVCNNYRVGLRARLPITQSSASGTGRAAADSLNGFAGAWRIGGVFDWIHDATSEDSESPSKFTMLSLQVGWGVQTFRYRPDGGLTDVRERETRHSVSVLGRFLAYVYPPRKTRVAPQVIVRYDRQWADADTVGVLVDDGDPSTPSFTVPTIIDRPRT
ncbi:MAG: hypothetical protein KDK70_21740, partial [Myxococcales bacterium]|nr:hypothetical protein [Myxococcales bacterium]